VRGESEHIAKEKKTANATYIRPKSVTEDMSQPAIAELNDPAFMNICFISVTADTSQSKRSSVATAVSLNSCENDVMVGSKHHLSIVPYTA
jgi:hypothetical protein